MNQIKVSLIEYSESVTTKKRLATFAIKIPKFVWGHVSSHRSLSRNSASSRAIPAKKIRTSVLKEPFIPLYFGENQSGMRAGEPLNGIRLFLAKKVWLWSRYIPVVFHFFGEKIGFHKEVLNRILEPWLMVDIVVSGTEWNNFIFLRKHQDAQPEIQYVAEQIETLLKNTQPKVLQSGEWHTPFILESESDIDIETKKKVSTARCARVSYKLFDGKVSNIEADIKLHDRLSSSGHWSPFEHVAQAMNNSSRYGNLVGFKQYRKEFENENNGDY